VIAAPGCVQVRYGSQPKQIPEFIGNEAVHVLDLFGREDGLPFVDQAPSAVVVDAQLLRYGNPAVEIAGIAAIEGKNAVDKSVPVANELLVGRELHVEPRPRLDPPVDPRNCIRQQLPDDEGNGLRRPAEVRLAPRRNDRIRIEAVVCGHGDDPLPRVAHVDDDVADRGARTLA